jgi:hypothetical protein
MHLYRSISDNDVSFDDGNSREESEPKGEDEPVYQRQVGVRVHGGAQKVCMKEEGDESSKSRQAVPYLVVLQYESMVVDKDDNSNKNNNNNAEQLDVENSSGGVSYRMVVDIHACTVVASVARNGTNATDAYLFMWNQTRFVRGLKKMLHVDVDLKSMEPERVRVIPMNNTSETPGQQLAKQRGAVVEMCMYQLCKDDPEHSTMNCSNIIIPGYDGDGAENEGKRGACLAAHHRGWISYAGIALSLATVMANVLLEWRSRASLMSRSRKHSDHENNDSSNNNDDDKGSSETNAEWQRTKMGRLKRGGSMHVGKMAHAHKSVQPWQ